MATTIIPQRRRRTRVLAGLFALLFLGLGAGTASASIRGEERKVERAEKKLEEAQRKVEEAQRKVEEAQRKVEEERERLEEQAKRDPKGHDPLDELNRLRKAVEEAEKEREDAREAEEKAEADLEKARERLAEEVDKYAKEFLRKNPIPRTADEIDDYIRRVRDDKNVPDKAKEKILEEAEKAKRATQESSSAAPVLPGARVVLTGTVVGGEAATLAVVGPAGQRLSGTVVEIDGEEHVTGPDGRVAFVVSGAVGVLRAALRSSPDATPLEVQVVGPPVESLTAAPPRVDRVPRYPTAGAELPIDGAGFDPAADGNVVALGDRRLDVLASSPTGLVASLPADLAGDVWPLVVSTANGSSEPVELTVVRFSLAGEHAHLTRGQTAVRSIRVEGTTDPVPLRITNLAPQVVAMEGGIVITATTRGGEPNTADVRFTGIARGDFELQAEVAETAPEPLSAEYWEAEAEKAAGEAAGTDPPDAQGDKTREGSAWSSAGHARSGRREYEEAAESFEKAAEAFEQAEREAQAAVERANARSAWSSAGDAARDAGDHARAEELYRRAAR